MRRRTLTAFLMGIASLIFLRCAGTVDSPGGSSASGNAKVTGSLYYENGAPAVNARASLIPAGYNPRRDAPLAWSQVITVDSFGDYSFSCTDSGDFNIQAAGDDRKMVLVKNIHVAGPSVTVAADTLRVPGAVKLLLPDEFDPATGYVYIPGTTLWADARGAVNNCFVLDGVPADSALNIYFAANLTAAPRILQANATVVPGDTTILVYSAWRYTAKLRLNTTIQGAAVNGTILDFPVFVRLGSPWYAFDFSKAKAGGADIRFTKADGTALPCEIESWDSVNTFAELWVRVDSVFGSSDVQYIQMHWGNPEAESCSDGAKVFDTAIGFQGVWHLQSFEQDTVRDVTYNHYNGVASRDGTNSPWTNEVGRFFNGSGCIRIPRTANSRLTVVPDGDYSLSVWVYLETPDTGFQMVAGNADRECVLAMSSQADGSRWSFAACGDSSAQSWNVMTDNHFVENKAWNLLVGVRRGGVAYLYINGMPVQSSGTPVTDFSSILRGAVSDFTIGGFIPPDTGNGIGGGYFHGIIDEVEFSDVARSADWIRLYYENQQVADSLLTFVIP